MYGAVCAFVVAPVLHLEERARAVARREGGEEACERLGVAAVYLGASLARQLKHTLIQIPLVVVAQHDVDTLDVGYFVRFELGVATRDGYYGIGVEAVYAAYEVAALLVGMFGYGAAVDDAYVGVDARCGAFESSLLEDARKGRTLRKIHFAAQRMEADTTFFHVVRFGFIRSKYRAKL